MANEAQLAQFWSLFREREGELKTITSADAPVYDALLEALHQISTGLYFEFSTNTGECHLIITADGNRELFAAAHQVVDAAPAVPGWAIRALKPKHGFPQKVGWDGVTLELADVMFDPLERKSTGELGLRLLVRHLDDSQATEAHNALLRALDHALGEERHATAVAFTQVVALPEDADKATFIPLLELEKFLDWRDAKRRSKH